MNEVDAVVPRVGSVSVSVVVPTIIFDEYLDLALGSLLKQDIEDFEVILVLDGVEPPSESPLFSSTRVKVVAIPERVGTPRALNAGISAASGEFVARLDADDLAAPSRLRRQREFLEAHPSIGCVGSFVHIIDSGGNAIGVLEGPSEPQEIRTALLTSNPLVHSSLMYRRTVVERVGLYSHEMTRMQDYDLLLRLALSTEIAMLPEVLTSYRVHLGQHSRRSVPWQKYTFRVMSRRMDLARASGSSPVGQLLRNAFWFAGQLLRHFGLVKPGYLRRAR